MNPSVVQIKKPGTEETLSEPVSTVFKIIFQNNDACQLHLCMNLLTLIEEMGFSS